LSVVECCECCTSPPRSEYCLDGMLWHQGLSEGNAAPIGPPKSC
jgi:hypothetical protein